MDPQKLLELMEQYTKYQDKITEIKEKYGDERRTEICAAENEIVYEDLIERHNCVITLTHAGWMNSTKRQRIPPSI